MIRKQKLVFLILVVFSLAYFVLFSFPNLVGTKNMAMVLMFQPDEATPLPYVMKMIKPAENLEQAIRSFIFYDNYVYGFPYFGASAVVLLPLQWLGKITDIPLVIYILRQLVSLVPMLLGLLLLVFMQDGFRTYRSPVLYAFLLAVPAVTQNNLWWHPDGLTFLFVVLTIFFLQRDKLQFGWNFLLAGVACGIVTATKVMGVYFIPAFLMVIVLGLVRKKGQWKKIIGMAFALLGIVFISYVISNPFLLSHWARKAYFFILNRESFFLTGGYGILYEKGFQAAWPLMRESFGQAIFLIAALGINIWGIFRGSQRLFFGIILSWFFPITIFLLTASLFKFQYWMPAALPMLSCIVVLLPEEPKLSDYFKPKLSRIILANVFRFVLLLIVLVQFGLFIQQDVTIIVRTLHQVEDNPRIKFFEEARDSLAKIPADIPLHLYYDARLYVPGTTGWTAETTFNLLDYGYITTNDYDVLLLLEQRIKDYLNPEATGTDPETFALAQVFYRDAENEHIQGYHLVFRNEVGLVYIKDDLYNAYQLSTQP